MTTHRLTTEDGLDLHVSVHGPDDAPPTALLAHCWTADEQDWHYQVRAVLDRYGHGVRLITWDHRGHGQSDPAPEHACTIPHLARDLGRATRARTLGVSKRQSQAFVERRVVRHFLFGSPLRLRDLGLVGTSSPTAHQPPCPVSHTTS